MLAKTVPHYKIENLALENAVSHLWKQVLGREPMGLGVKVETSEYKTSLSLDVRETSARQILDYLAELSGCHWSVRGWGSEGLSLYFTGIVDCGKMVYADTFVLNDQGLSTFGLSKDAAAQDLIPVLEHYGIRFAEGVHGFANYHGHDQTLTVCLIEEQMPMMKTVVRLANAGQLRPYQRP